MKVYKEILPEYIVRDSTLVGWYVINFRGDIFLALIMPRGFLGIRPISHCGSFSFRIGGGFCKFRGRVS